MGSYQPPGMAGAGGHGMTRRQERHATRPDGDLEPEAVESAPSDRIAGEELPESDLDAVPFEPPAVEPADPVAAAQALRGRDPLREFSDNARKRYDMEVSTFAADLLKHSLARKRARGGGDNVTGRDVTSAACFLRTHRASGSLKYLDAIGGLLVGLGAQSLAGMVEAGVYTTAGVLWSVGTAAAGAALFIWHATQNRW